MTAERRYAIQGRRDWEAERIEHATAHMRENKAYRYAVQRAGGDPGETILKDYIDRFRAYRIGWRAQPQRAIEQKLHDTYVRVTGSAPLSVDIEAAAVCDLACSFCYRQHIATPDKLMDEALAYRLIDQCAELGVPAVKFTWRGEPLLHPKLPQMIDYAKQKGTLETLINTDAVTLTEEKARALIESGLDVIIYSFDGGTKETYEKMRVGRFHSNHFDEVYENIRRFARIKKEMGAPWPHTKIQMILTRDTYDQQEEFAGLFDDCVDHVSVKAYTERGGSLETLDPVTRERVGGYLDAKGLPREPSVHWRDMDGNVFISAGRLPCEQPYQRLMVAYDGTVSMCCYDWGNEYPIGFADARAFASRADYQAVFDKAKKNAKGFALLSDVKMPTRYEVAPHVVQTLAEIWDGAVVNAVRKMHVDGEMEYVPICTECPFKETYVWERVPETATAPASPSVP